MAETQIISVDVEYPDGYLRYTNSRYSFCEFSVNCMNELNFDKLYIELSGIQLSGICRLRGSLSKCLLLQ